MKKVKGYFGCLTRKFQGAYLIFLFIMESICCASELQTSFFAAAADESDNPLSDEEMKATPPKLDLESKFCFRLSGAYELDSVDCTDKIPILLIPRQESYVDLVFSDPSRAPVQALKVQFSWQGLGKLPDDCSASAYNIDPDHKFDNAGAVDCKGEGATVILRSGLWIPARGPFVVARLKFKPEGVGFGRLKIHSGEVPEIDAPGNAQNRASASIEVKQTLEIISSPALFGVAGAGYQYDTDGCAMAHGMGKIKWNKISGPGDLVVEPNSGCIRWTPKNSGVFVVGIMATDGVYAANQIFSVVVNEPTGIAVSYSKQ